MKGGIVRTVADAKATVKRVHHILTHHNGTGHKLSGWEIAYNSYYTAIACGLWMAVVWGVFAVGPGQ